MYFIFNDFTFKKKSIATSVNNLFSSLLHYCLLSSSFFPTAFLQLPVANFIHTLFKQKHLGIMFKNGLLVPIFSTGNENGKYLKLCTAEQ